MFFPLKAEELEYEIIDDRVSLSDRVAALNIPLRRTGVSSEELTEEVELDQFPVVSICIFHDVEH